MSSGVIPVLSATPASSGVSKNKPDLFIKELARKTSNKACFDCGRAGPQNNVNMSIGTFICTQCGGIHRNFSHKVKTINASTFTVAEAEFLENAGNKKMKKVWLHSFDEKEREAPTWEKDDSSFMQIFMKKVYVEKKYYKDPEKEEEDSSGEKKKKKKKEKEREKEKDKPSEVTRQRSTSSVNSTNSHTNSHEADRHVTPSSGSASHQVETTKPKSNNDLGIDFLSNLTITEAAPAPAPTHTSSFSAFSQPFAAASNTAIPSSTATDLYSTHAFSESNSSSTFPSSSSSSSSASNALEFLVSSFKEALSRFSLSNEQLNSTIQQALSQLQREQQQQQQQQQQAAAAAAASSSRGSFSASSSSNAFSEPPAHLSAPAPAPVPTSSAAFEDAFADIPLPAGHAADSGNPFDDEDEEPAQPQAPGAHAFPAQYNGYVPTQAPSTYLPQQYPVGGMVAPSAAPSYPAAMTMNPQLAAAMYSTNGVGYVQPTAGPTAGVYPGQGTAPNMVPQPSHHHHHYAGQQQQLQYQQQLQQQQLQQQQQQQLQQQQMMQFQVPAAAPQQPPQPQKPDLFSGLVNF